MRVRFDEFEFDTDQFTLVQSGRVAAMEPHVFDVLAFLIANRDRVVSKEELLDGIWDSRTTRPTPTGVWHGRISGSHLRSRQDS